MRHLIIFSVLAISYTSLAAELCRGRWTYTEHQSCAASQHEDDLSSPITQTGGTCGYHQKRSKCWAGDAPAGAVKTRHKIHRDRDRHHTGSEIVAYCKSKQREIRIGEQERIASVSFADLVQGRRCGDRDRFRNCKWYHKDSEFNCVYNLRKKTFAAHASCPLVTDHSNPKTCTLGYNKVNKRSRYCPKKVVTTGFGTSIRHLTGVNWRYGWTCSTGDHLAENSPEQINRKIDFLVKKLSQEKITKKEALHISDTLSELYDENYENITDDLRETIEETLNQANETILNKNVIFDARYHCINFNGSSYTNCQNSDQTFTNFSNRYSEYLEIEHVLDIVYQCQADADNNGLYIQAGNESFYLAPTSHQEVQKLRFLINSKDYQYQLKTQFRPSLAITSGCRIEIMNNTLQVSRLKNFIDRVSEKAASLGDILGLIQEQSGVDYEGFQDDLSDYIKAENLNDYRECRTLLREYENNLDNPASLQRLVGSDQVLEDMDGLCPRMSSGGPQCSEASAVRLGGSIGRIHSQMTRGLCLLESYEASRLCLNGHCATDSQAGQDAIKRQLEELERMVTEIETVAYFSSNRDEILELATQLRVSHMNLLTIYLGIFEG